MKEITDISAQKKSDERINIYLDGKFAFAVEYETAVKLGLKKGAMLSPDDEKEIARLEGESSAFDKGLKYAVKKVVSERQMRDYLLRAAYNEVAVAKAIDKLKEYGYIDDKKFVKAYVSTYKSSLGKKRISLGLKNAGICPELIEEGLSEVDEKPSCRTCVEKYLRTHKEADKRKLYAYLLYRGFDSDEIKNAMEESGYEFD